MDHEWIDENELERDRKFKGEVKASFCSSVGTILDTLPSTITRNAVPNT